jgi:tyrosyl-tRNA synthetase
VIEETSDDVIEILEQRGFVDALTDEELRNGITEPLKVYAGFDPTADSLHVGNLVAIMGLAWFQRCGHTPVAIIGGATGMVGDPSGKSIERPLLSPEMIEENLQGIRKNLEVILDFEHKTAAPVILNNYDWFSQYNFIEFLRDIGKMFRVGPMLAKDSVKTRLNSDVGISYTEFSYQVLQGYDFLHLYDNDGVTMQVGGSDQWGNITAGTELIRKVRGAKAYGVTFPLLTRSDGKKFGKSESGTIWLSEHKLSSYDFYQYFFRLPDADVIKMMKMLTFMPIAKIKEIEENMSREGYKPNTAQRRLAEEVTLLVRGEEGLKRAEAVTNFLRPGASIAPADIKQLKVCYKDMPNKELNEDEIIGEKLLKVFVSAEMSATCGEARRLIRNGGAYINDEKIDDENAIFTKEMIKEDEFCWLAAGKKKKKIIRVTREKE